MIDRNVLLAAAMLVSMFVAGFVSGLMTERLLLPTPSLRDFPGWDGPRPRPGVSGPGRPGPSGPVGRAIAPDFSTGVLARHLELNQDQETQVRRILDERRAAMDSVMKNLRPVMEAEFGAMNDEIRALLTDEQRERFDSFVADRFGRIGLSRPGGGMRPPPPPLPTPR